MDRLAATGVSFTPYDGMVQDDRGIWTAPYGARVAWFHEPRTPERARAPSESVTSHSHSRGPVSPGTRSRTGCAHPLGSTRYFSPVRRAVNRLTASLVSILSRLTRWL